MKINKNHKSLISIRKFAFAAILLGFTLGFSACDESFFDEDDEDDDEDVIQINVADDEKTIEMDTLNTIENNVEEIKPE